MAKKSKAEEKRAKKTEGGAAAAPLGKAERKGGKPRGKQTTKK